MVAIQAIINVMDYDEAINAAETAYLKGAEIIEIGTKLIKKFGLNIAKDIKLRLPRTKIYLDTLIIEDPEFDFEIARECGADIISVLGISSLEVIRKCLELSRKYVIDIALDFSGISDPVNKVLETIQVGPFYYRINMPKGRSEELGFEMRQYYKSIKELARVSPVPIAVRINNDLSIIPYIINSGVSYIILDIYRNSESEIESLFNGVNKAITTAFL